MIRRRIIVAAVVVAGVLTSGLATAGTAAAAGPGGTTTTTTAGGGCDGGGGCWSNLSQYITTGGTDGYHVAPGGGNVVPMANVPPPACWMAPFNNGNDSGKAMAAWWKQYTQSGDPMVAAGIGGANYPQQFAKHAKDGPGKGAWYERVQNPNAPGNEGIQCVSSLPVFQWVAAGQPVPLPKLPPRELAMYALSTLKLPQPQFNLSPGNRTYVTLPTFVTDLQGVPHDPVQVWAELNGVRAVVQVTNNGVTFDTPSRQQYTNCGPDGTRESQAQMDKAGPHTAPDCGVVYQSPSTGYGNGYPFTVTVTWNATFQGQPIGPNPIQMNSVTHHIPVAEIQSINNNG